MEGLKYVRGAITFEGFIPKDEALEEKLQDVQYYLEVTRPLLSAIHTHAQMKGRGDGEVKCQARTVETAAGRI